MEDLKSKIKFFSRTSNKKPTPKELRTILNYIIEEALEYHLSEYVDENYIDTLLNDIRNKDTPLLKKSL